MNGSVRATPLGIRRIDLVDLITLISRITLIDTISSITLIDTISEITNISKIRGLHWYDRAPVSIADEEDTTYVPHGSTSRLSYIVPANKIGLVEILYAQVRRRIVATVGGDIRATWRLTPTGGLTKTILEANLFGEDNTIGDRDKMQLGTVMPIFEGDQLQLLTSDASTGGNVTYRGAYKISVFDK